MRLVIDMQGAQTDSRFRGIGRYTLSLAQAMVRQAALRHHEVLLVVNAQMPEGLWGVRKAFEGLLEADRIRVFDVPAEFTEGGWGNAVSEPIREAFLASLDPDVVLISSVIEGFWNKAVTSIGRVRATPKTAAVLYDLIPLLHPDVYLTSPELRRFYAQKVATLRRADLLLSISESSRNEGLNHLGAEESSVVNVSAAIGPEFRPVEMDFSSEKELLERLGISRHFVLYAPGGFDQRKNFARLIEAFSLLPEHVRACHQLVVVSKLNHDSRRQMIEWRNQYGLSSEELVLPGYVEDADLIALYSLTALFVFPSLHEGFGLPVLEAMACGAPVIGSNCTSVPEVIGWDEALFDPLSVHSICDKLTQALLDRPFWNRLKARSLSQSRTFSWDASAEKAWRAIEALHAAPLPRDDTTEDGSESDLLRLLAEIPGGTAAEESLLNRAAQCLVFNQGAKRPQLLLDVSELAKGDARSGIQRVVRSILCECLRCPPDGFEVRPIRYDGVRYWYANRLAATLATSTASQDDEVADFFQGDVYLCLDLLMHLGKDFHALHRELAVRGVVLNYVVYDLLPLQHPEWWAAIIGPQFREWMIEICRQADRVICISNAVADELRQWLEEMPPERTLTGPCVASFHLGADLDGSAPSTGLPGNADALLAKMNELTTFLMVSTLEPRKGHAQALDAFEYLWAKGLDVCLVIVGKRGWKIEALAERISAHCEFGKRLLWIENASDEFLAKIYSSCDCLLMASLGEGFGLPLIEAAQHGLPLIARDIPVLREIGGNHAHYFQGMAADDLGRSIEHWLVLRKDHRHPTSVGLPWLTWKASTRQLLTSISVVKPESDVAEC